MQNLSCDYNNLFHLIYNLFKFNFFSYDILILFSLLLLEIYIFLVKKCVYVCVCKLSTLAIL
jgi:hypothetical protein